MNEIGGDIEVGKHREWNMKVRCERVDKMLFEKAKEGTLGGAAWICPLWETLWQLG